MDYGQKQLQKEAEEVLIQNWRDGYTIPSPKLYPFQWLWDSGFISIGLSHCAPDKALQEIRSLFRGQWENGMMPHIIFHEENENYFPGPDVWKTLSGAISRPQTSGIIQPPVIGFILECLHDRARHKAPVMDLIKEVYPKLRSFHEYLYRERDRNEEGLIYLRHNWESGLDNAPVWDNALQSIERLGEDLSKLRKDLVHIDSSQRPADVEYQQYLWLVYLFSEYHYDEKSIYENSPFLLQDPFTNALLIESNDALSRLGALIGEETGMFEGWAQKGAKAMNRKLWDEQSGAYRAYDLYRGCHIDSTHIPAFAAALFAGIPDEAQIDTFIKQTIEPMASRGDCYLLPTVPPGSPHFEPQKYWRGPVWININWLFYHGLRRYGYHEWAHRVKEDTVSLVRDHGFYEYFNPMKKEGKGYGTDQFSWTAALFLDLLHE